MLTFGGSAGFLPLKRRWRMHTRVPGEIISNALLIWEISHSFVVACSDGDSSWRFPRIRTA